MKLLARRITLWIKWNIIKFVGFILGLIRTSSQTLSVWPKANVDLAPKIALFAHYDASGHVRQQILDYIEDLQDNGYSVAFVTNSDHLVREATEKLKSLCSFIIVRRNIGYDFGAWRDAIRQLALPRFETQEIILINDSVFGPLYPIRDLLRRLDFNKSDIWGLTESWQGRYHLQSFFLAFGPKALRSDAFNKFWLDVKPVSIKLYVIQNYEIGITQAMIKGGLRCAAIWPYERLVKDVDAASWKALIEESETTTGAVDPIVRNRKLHAVRLRDSIARQVTLNPTTDLWRQLLLAGFPFIKRELLRDNPTRVEDIGEWIDVLREHLAVNPDPVLLELRTMLKDTAP